MNEQVIAVRLTQIDSPEGVVPPRYEVRLRIGAQEDPPAPFTFDLQDQSRIMGVIRDLETENCGPDTLRDIGACLWSGLVGPDRVKAVREAIATVDHATIALHLPDNIEHLPWETLYDTQLRYVACNAKLNVVHILDSARREAAADGSPRPLTILVVVPQGSNLDIDSEWKNLNTAVKLAKLDDAVKLVELRGIVDPARLRELLTSQRWDVVHFIGHGRVIEQRIEVRLNDAGGDELWRNADQFTSLFDGADVNVCLLNCCKGGAARGVRTLNRLAPGLIGAGVRGVVAMRYEMSDTSAIRFSTAFYSALLRSDVPGRVGYAAQLARKALFESTSADEQRAFVAPLVHTAGPDQCFFDVPRADARRAPSRPVERRRQIPARLLDAVADRRCVLVVGPDLASEPAPAVRDGTPRASGLLALLERLSNTIDPPSEAEDLSRSEGGQPKRSSSAPLFSSVTADVALQRLAERFYASNKGPLLLETVRDFCVDQQNAVDLYRNLASWMPPALFYTHFDGRMEGVRPPVDRVAIVRGLTEPVPKAESVLVLVRGSIVDLDSLVLSENDHYELAQRVEQMHPSLAGLARPEKSKLRSVVFIGLGPGDVIARHLARKLLGGQRIVPENYFISEAVDPDERWFWKGRFNTQFVPMSAEAFISAAAPHGGGAA